MNKLFFYPKLAAQNLRKNSQFTLPFALTAAGCAALFYIMRFLIYSDLTSTMIGASFVTLELSLGCIVIGIMVFCLLWYANRFVMKRREREMGLYHILGMKKSQVGILLACETVFTALGGTAAGILAGILFSKLALLLLVRLLEMAVPMGFYISGAGVGETIVLMALVFALLLAHNLWRLGRMRPVELLHSAEVGEREPKSRRLMALLGAVCLGGGYAIALTTKNPLDVMTLFFPAVILVVIGTFSLFSAGSVVVLKALRKNKRYYYQPRHFTAVSGLLYRMGQNAKGLANICILSTMVLVTVSCTVCLYTGIGDQLEKVYPNAITVYFRLEPGAVESADLAALDGAVSAATEDYGCGLGSGRFGSRLQMDFLALQQADGSYALENANYVDFSDEQGRKSVMLSFITAEDYTRATGQEVQLAPDEVLAYGLPAGAQTFAIEGEEYRVAGELEAPVQNFAEMQRDMGNMIEELRCIVLADRAALHRMYELQLAAYGEKRTSAAEYRIALDPATGADTELDCAEAAKAAAQALLAENESLQGVRLSHYSSRWQDRGELYNIYGGFLFLGLFLGLAFLLATVLIIYYKQLSEGYEDRQRFVILQKVGMSQKEVRAAIRTQVLLVFFLPLVLAALHICMAFPMLQRLLTLFSLTNTSLFMGCVAVTFLLFAGVYVLVYSLTAKQYYRIVRA